ncbi:hypothetical protein [Nostoc sp.]|uniref:hypothetical protein n=1 Tax=Nostoc sp. TaxID=1180 RepID=UPI002FFB44F9
MRKQKIPNKTSEIEQTGLFGEVVYRSYRWDATYNSASYLNLLNTYSGHLNLDRITRTLFSMRSLN